MLNKDLIECVTDACEKCFECRVRVEKDYITGLYISTSPFTKWTTCVGENMLNVKNIHLFVQKRLEFLS